MTGRPSVVLVCDRPAARSELRFVLENEGRYRVVGWARTAEEAVEVVRDATPELVALHVSGPSTSALEATRRLVSAASPGTRVVTVGMHSDKGLLQGDPEAGSADYVLERSAPEKLIASLDAVLEVSTHAGDDVEEGRADPAHAWRGAGAQDSPANTAHMISVLPTRLNRPRLPPEIQPRRRLMERMGSALEVPLTLIVAPPGYGKSRAASEWVEHSGCAAAWVSLDPALNDIRNFLAHTALAIQQAVPRVGNRIRALTFAPRLPDVPELLRELVTDLAPLEEPLVLVLDDMQNVQDEAIMDLLGGLLERPHPWLHLVVVTRWDPPLPLHRLRARRELLEIGVEALRFTAAETAAYLRAVLGPDVDPEIAAALQQATEGWWTGIHLAAAAARTADDLPRLVRSLEGQGLELITTYLVEEVLATLSGPDRDRLLQISVLRRFNAALCEAVWAEAAAVDEGAGSPGSFGEGEAFLDRIRQANLFVVPLDAEGYWFRFHSLFRALIESERERRLEPERVAGAQRRAARWLAANALPDEAVGHLLAAGDLEGAAELIEARRLELLELHEWPRLDAWLGELPAPVRDSRPALLLAHAWVAEVRSEMEAIARILERLEAIVDHDRDDPMVLRELAYFQAVIRFWTGQVEEVLRTLEPVVEDGNAQPDVVSAMAEFYYGLALQASGRYGDAVRRFRRFAERAADQYRPVAFTRAHSGIAVIGLLQGRLGEAHRAGTAVVRGWERWYGPARQGFVRYLLGLTELHWGVLDEACDHFQACVAERYITTPRAAVDAMAGLALGEQLAGRTEEAERTVRLAADFSRWTMAGAAEGIARSLQARIDLLRGDVDAARRWERRFEDTPSGFGESLFVENPFLTQCRVLLARDTPESLREAADRLDHLDGLYLTFHNTLQRIEVAVLRAAVLRRQGRTDQAKRAAAGALELAAPGRWIRPFVELGTIMADLLDTLRQVDTNVPHLDDILEALTATRASTGPTSPLTDRETEVLARVAQGLSNKSIARSLHISVETVKKHLYNVYRKLDVPNRAAAAAAARDMGIQDAPPDR